MKATSTTSKASCTPKTSCRSLDTDARTKTVRDLMKPDVYFVPETKLGSELLREMQRDNIRMAIVIDEYGGVAGLVTIEDLVEEIVGEIRDEHEKSEVVKENESSYIFNGNTDVDLLEKLLGVRPDEKEATTIAGLVSELAGHIPRRVKCSRRTDYASKCWNPPNAASIECGLVCKPVLPPRRFKATSMLARTAREGPGVSLASAIVAPR